MTALITRQSHRYPSRRKARLRAVPAMLSVCWLGSDVEAQDRAPQRSALEEIVVTATRVETDLQTTPLSVAALTSERLELGGIDSGRDLGLRVPNAVFSPSPGGERASMMVIRGMPGVETYVDGVWFSGFGFQQRNFVELERVEVLRGPQGTHFGRNTNGGAVQLITRRPADEFGARFDVELGELERRAVKVAVDVPIAERLTTKWIAARNEVDGFLDNPAAGLSFGDEEESLLRGDVVWRPTDAFSLRVNLTDQSDEGSDARIVRISNANNPVYVAYNVLAGNPEYLARARAINPAFPNPPFPLDGDRYTPETHEAGYPGGTLGRWQTRSSIASPTSALDTRNVTLTLDWRATDHWSLKSLSSHVEIDSHQLTDWDASEFTHAAGLGRNSYRGASQELHVAGDHLDGRLRTLLGVYYLERSTWLRGATWWFWEFAVPNTGPNFGLPGPPGVDGRPLLNPQALSYVRAWGATVGNGAVANFLPLTFLTADRLSRVEDGERAIFGEVTMDLTDRLELTLGFRQTKDEQVDILEFVPADAFRTTRPGEIPNGDPFATAALIADMPGADLGTISTPRLSLGFRATDAVYLYASYAEGFTAGEVITNPFVAEPIVLGPEVVATREIGLRSEWLDRRLRFNATYFDSRWEGLRVPKTLEDPDNPGLFLPVAIPTDDGVAAASGAEFELAYVAGERTEIDFALGLLDTEYLEIGEPPANGTGLQPGIPFAFAPDTSYSLGVQHRLPLASAGEMLFRVDYSWMDDYERAVAADFQSKNPDGSNAPEPAYGLLNARIVFTPAQGNWRLSLFGTNLTNEWYVNGGFDLGPAWGYAPALIGRPREAGVGVQFAVD